VFATGVVLGAGAGAALKALGKGRKAFRAAARAADEAAESPGAAGRLVDEAGEAAGVIPAARHRPSGEKGTRSTKATRAWYHTQLDTMPSKIEGLPLREQALKAFQLRNEAKVAARELMADRAAAAALPPPFSIADLTRKAYRNGLYGDSLWIYIRDAS